MDGILKDYRGLSPETGLKRIKEIIDIVCEHNGVVTFNWHNTFLSGANNPWREVFENSLNYLEEKQVEMITSLKCAEMWGKLWDRRI